MSFRWLFGEEYKRRWPTLYAAIMGEEGVEAKLQRLIDHPATPYEERTAAERALARLAARVPGETGDQP